MLKNLYGKTKYELCILSFLLVQFFVFRPATDGMPVWQLLTYLSDYSHGFVPRGLIGEIISWFSDTVSLEMLHTLSSVVCIALIIVAALLGGTLIRKAENKYAVTAFVTIMVTSPIFMPLFSSWLGITDIYLILLTFVAFVFNENRILRYLVPAIALLCVAIHHVYLFLYMVPLAIAMLYDCFNNKKYIRDGLLCGVTYTSLIAFAFVIIKTRLAEGFGSIDEMIAFMIKKADFPLSEEWLASVVPNEYMTGADHLASHVTVSMSVGNLLGLAVILLPLFVLFAYGWIKSIRHSKDKSEKFIFFLCLIHPLSTAPAFFFGLNWNRWTSAIITSQCILYLFMLYRKNKTLSAVAMQISEFFRKHFMFVLIYFIYYTSFAKLLGI